jgi:conjugative transposon TraN protein
MKAVRILFIFQIVISIHITGLSQTLKSVYLPFNKTIHLIFPKDILYLDVGSNDILVEKTNAIVKLAPRREDFEVTNLTVVTVDNVWYTFLLTYRKESNDLIYLIDSHDGRKVEGSLVKSEILENQQRIITKMENDSFAIQCRDMLDRAPSYLDVGAVSRKVYLALNNIYICNEKLYFVMTLGNTSNIPYDIDLLQLSVVNRKKLKRAAMQEVNKEPLYVYNKTEQLLANTRRAFLVLVYSKFTLNDDQKLVFEMIEKNGGRNLRFEVKKDLIIKAKAL